MSNTNKVVKSVAFNRKNPEEKQLLDYVKRRNFSKYVKKLMLDDYVNKMNEKMERSLQQEPYYQHNESNHYNTPQPLSPAEHLSQLKQRRDQL